MKTNKKVSYPHIKTGGGAAAANISDLLQLKRSVMACMLWEDTAYEGGVRIADKIKETIAKVKPRDVVNLAILAREDMKLRHVPLYMARCMAELPTHKAWVADLLYKIIQRPDELTEFLSIYWRLGKCPISAQVKKGLAKAFTKFDEYQLAKYNRDAAIKLRDVLFLCHAKPKDHGQTLLWQKLIDNTLTTPDTWEVELSQSTNKGESWIRLLTQQKLGALALLRNLRNMIKARVPDAYVKEALRKVESSRVLPFRFVAAARHAPRFEQDIEVAMLKCLADYPKFSGKSVIIIDESGSMGLPISSKSQMSRYDAAHAIAILLRERCEDVQVYATAGNDYNRSHATVLVPARRGFALATALTESKRLIGDGGIFLKQVMDFVKEHEKFAERVIVITDEQDCDIKCNPLTADAFGKRNYLINIASNTNGIGYGKWLHIDGFSEACIDYIYEYEAELDGL